MSWALLLSSLSVAAEPVWLNTSIHCDNAVEPWIIYRDQLETDRMTGTTTRHVGWKLAEHDYPIERSIKLLIGFIVRDLFSVQKRKMLPFKELGQQHPNRYQQGNEHRK